MIYVPNPLFKKLRKAISELQEKFRIRH